MKVQRNSNIGKNFVIPLVFLISFKIFMHEIPKGDQAQCYTTKAHNKRQLELSTNIIYKDQFSKVSQFSGFGNVN